VAVVRRLVRVSIVGVAVVAGVLAASAWLFSRIPQSFLPEEDQGAIFAALRLPEGASINRTEAVVKEIEDIVTPIPGVRGKLAPADPKPGNEVIAAPYALAAIRFADLSSETPSVPRNWIGAFLDWGK
jgi:multidrug efflux pump subunit AcrB